MAAGRAGEPPHALQRVHARGSDTSLLTEMASVGRYDAQAPEMAREIALEADEQASALRAL